MFVRDHGELPERDNGIISIILSPEEIKMMFRYRSLTGCNTNCRGMRVHLRSSQQGRMARVESNGDLFRICLSNDDLSKLSGACTSNIIEMQINSDQTVVRIVRIFVDAEAVHTEVC